ncbi:MAG: YidC/Oxa1 family membrane protein insertase [Anaerovoracaceae bacterium]|jgi:YidC/Oxa1 family membrane protein insertase
MNAVIGAIAKPLGTLLFYIYDLVGSYGIALLILTTIVKFALYPLYAKQIKSTANMGKIQPKMKALQQKYANDKAMLNQKMSELYKEENFNPMAGCLPMIIQMPIIFGLFALLRNPLLYMGENNNMLFAVHESFLWMSDLSQPDKWILPIAAGIATYFSFAMSQKQQASTTAVGGMGNMMKMMKYFFPVMIVLMARAYPAGLSIYWFFSQVIQVFFNLRFNKMRKKLNAEGGKKK